MPQTSEEDDANTTITVEDDVTIDLNGSDIDGGYEAGVSEGSKDSVITVDKGGDLTIKDSSEDQSGTITGGNAVAGVGNENKVGGGVFVSDGSLTLDGGSITGNHAAENGGGVCVYDGEFTMNNGAITDNTTQNAGGGVYLNTEWAAQKGEETRFVMNGGEISGNTVSAGSGGGIGASTDQGHKEYTKGYDSIVINGGTIKDNSASGNGGAISSTNGTIKINGGDDSKAEISGNTAGRYGGGIYNYDSNMKISNAEISDNEAQVGGGVFSNKGTVVIGKTSKVFDNAAGTHSDDVYSNGSKLTLYIVDGMNETLTEDGKPITGWYKDGSVRWGDGYQELVLPYQPGTLYSGGVLCLKAAHDEYFNVEYTDGMDGTLFESQTYGVENKNPIPVFEGEIPVRPGYTFAGWLADGEDFDPENGIVTGTLTLVAAWIPIPEEPEVPEEPDLPVDPEEPDVPEEPDLPETPEEPDAPDVPVVPEEPDDTGGTDDAEDAGTTIDEGAVPLASGPVTRAEFVDNLWRHEGQPAPVAVSGLFEDVTAEHAYSPAMTWAKSIGIIAGYEDGTFKPDELVTVSAVRGILARYAVYLGIEMPELLALVGEDEEPVLNCDEVIREFFGE